MRVNHDLWAIVRHDGAIAGDGESSCIYSRLEDAQEALKPDGPVNFKGFLESINGSPLRIAHLWLVEATEAQEPECPSQPKK